MHPTNSTIFNDSLRLTEITKKQREKPISPLFFLSLASSYTALNPRVFLNLKPSSNPKTSERHQTKQTTTHNNTRTNPLFLYLRKNCNCTFNDVSWNAWNPTSYGINPQNNASNSKPWKKPTKTQKHKKTKNQKKKRNPESHLTSHTLLFSLLFTLLLFALCVDFFSKNKCLLYLQHIDIKVFLKFSSHSSNPFLSRSHSRPSLPVVSLLVPSLPGLFKQLFPKNPQSVKNKIKFWFPCAY